MSETRIDAILRLLVSTACDAAGVCRGAAYLADGSRPGRFAGRVAHPAGELEAAVRRMTVGGEADLLTREILQARAPVLVEDARTDPRTARGAVRALRVGAVLGVPMVHGDEVVGLLFLDTADAQARYTPAHLRVVSALAEVAAGAVAEAQAAARLRGRFDTLVRQNRLLRHATAADHRLAQVVLGGGGLAALVATAAELTGKPVALYDAHRHCVAGAPAPGDGAELGVTLLEDAGNRPEVTGPMRTVAAGTCAAVAPLLAAGIRHRHLLAPVDLGGERWGWLVVMEHRSRMNAYDEFTARRAATHVALELSAQQRAAAAAWDARSALARQLMRGTRGLRELRRSADYLGIALDVPRVCVFVGGRGGDRGAGIEAAPLVAAIRRRVEGDVLATTGPEGVAALIDVPEEQLPLCAVTTLKGVVAEACVEAGGELDLIAGLSTVCREPRSLPRAYREAREVARCIDAVAGPGAHRVLAADDLGPGRLFVANSDAAEIERFVDDVIGALLDGDAGNAELLRTLQSFYDTGRSVRLSAARLRVHENTVRYRLARIRAATGLDVAADASDQLSAQMALLVLRLRGHEALPSFEARPEATVLVEAAGS